MIVLVVFGMVAIGENAVLASGASISAVPSVQTVAPGASFTVDINVTTSTPTRGIQFAVAWDPTKAQCTSVEEGSFYQGFVQQNSGMSEMVMPSSPSASNTAGTFPASGSLSIGLMGGTNNVTGVALGPSGTGTVFILNMTALSGASGTVTYTLSSIGLSDNSEPSINLNPTVNNGQVTISGTTTASNTTTTTTTTTTPTTTTMTTTPTTTTTTTTTTPTTTTTTTPTTTTPTTTSTTTTTTTPPTTTTTTTTPTTTTTTATPTTTTITPATATMAPVTTTVVTTFSTSAPTAANAESTLGDVTSLDLSQSMDISGMLHADFIQGNIPYSGNNEIVSLEIASGTRVVSSADGSPVDSITIQPGSDVPSPPIGDNIVSAVDFGPSGTIFSSSITVVFGYDAAEVPANGSGLTLECYNNEANQWVKCDYTVDTQDHQITALMSHFSLYAVMDPTSSGFMGVGWSLAGTIILVFLVLGALVVYYFVRRIPRPVPETAGRMRPMSNVLAADLSGSAATSVNESDYYDGQKSTKVNWDDILPRKGEKAESFKTRLEIVGGKIVISGNGNSSDIEIINEGNSRVIISLDYDPVSHPRGIARIITLGSAPGNKEIKE